jgi:hypothetical protein
MRRFLSCVFISLVFPCQARASEPPFTIPGGLSPDKTLAIVVYGNIDWNAQEGDDISKLEESAFLYDESARKIIGPLEEVDIDGGGYGHTQDNLSAAWSPDGKFVAVTFRAGRLMQDYAIYRVQLFFSSGARKFRAVPQKIPSEAQGPDGEKIFANVTTGANPGDTVEKWLGPTEISVVEYGLRPRDEGRPISNMINAQGEIRIIYRFANGAWIIKKFERLPDNY